MFLRKEDLINLALDTGVLVSSGVLFKHCMEVDGKWTIQQEFKETKNEKGETVYVNIPGTRKVVDKETLNQISKFKQLVNFAGQVVAVYGMFVGGIKFSADFITAIENRSNDKRFNSYWEKYTKIIKDESLNIDQKQEAVSCLRQQYKYVNLFDEYNKAQDKLIGSACDAYKKNDSVRLKLISDMMSELEKGKKISYEEYVKAPKEENKTEVQAQIVSVWEDKGEEKKKEPAKSNLDTAIENKKEPVFDEA